MRPEHAISYVYVMGIEGGPAKIGRSFCPEERRKQIEAKQHQTVFIVGTWAVGYNIAFCVERYAHWLLRERHFHGEWFNVSVQEACDAVAQAIAADVHPDCLIPALEPVGKKKAFKDQAVARFVEGTFARIASRLRTDEVQADFIREAVEREIERRDSRMAAGLPDRPVAL